MGLDIANKKLGGKSIKPLLADDFYTIKDKNKE